MAKTQARKSREVRTAQAREWRKKNPERYKESIRRWVENHPEYWLTPKYKANRRKSRIKRLYGITDDAVSEMILSQEGKCKICLLPLEKPHIDHCHKTGMIRGLLCFRCNAVEGLLKDADLNVLIPRLLAYVEGR